MAIPTVPRSSAYRMADRLLAGRLAERMREHRANGLSWPDISRRLYDEAGIEASDETLRTWAKALGISEAA